MPDHHALLELVKLSEALSDALREAYGLAQAGESGKPLRETLHYARDLLDIANEMLAGDPQAGEHARGMAMHMAEQLAAVEALVGQWQQDSALALTAKHRRPIQQTPPKRDLRWR